MKFAWNYACHASICLVEPVNGSWRVMSSFSSSFFDRRNFFRLQAKNASLYNDSRASLLIHFGIFELRLLSAQNGSASRSHRLLISMPAVLGDTIEQLPTFIVLRNSTRTHVSVLLEQNSNQLRFNPTLQVPHFGINSIDKLRVMKVWTFVVYWLRAYILG